MFNPHRSELVPHPTGALGSRTCPFNDDTLELIAQAKTPKPTRGVGHRRPTISINNLCSLREQGS